MLSPDGSVRKRFAHLSRGWRTSLGPSGIAALQIIARRRSMTL
jgi:hypothetical protein